MSIPYYAFREFPLKYRCDHVSEEIERSKVDRDRNHDDKRGGRMRKGEEVKLRGITKTPQRGREGRALMGDMSFKMYECY